VPKDNPYERNDPPDGAGDGEAARSLDHQNDGAFNPPPGTPTATVPKSPGHIAPTNPTDKEPRGVKPNMSQRPMPIAASRPSRDNPRVETVTATEASKRMARFEEALRRVWKTHLKVLGHGDPRIDHTCRKEAAAYLMRNEPEVLAALNFKVVRTA